MERGCGPGGDGGGNICGAGAGEAALCHHPPHLHLMINTMKVFFFCVAQEAVRRVLQGVGDRLEDLEEGSDFQVEPTFFLVCFRSVPVGLTCCHLPLLLGSDWRAWMRAATEEGSDFQVCMRTRSCGSGCRSILFFLGGGRGQQPPGVETRSTDNELPV